MWISRLGDGRWRSDRADGPEFQVNAVLMVSSEAICVSMCCRDCQHNILFLGSGQISLPQEHRGGDSGFGLNHPRQQGLGAKQVGNESEELLKGGEGNERRAQFHLWKITYDLPRRSRKQKVNTLPQSWNRRLHRRFQGAMLNHLIRLVSPEVIIVLSGSALSGS